LTTFSIKRLFLKSRSIGRKSGRLIHSENKSKLIFSSAAQVQCMRG